MPYIIFFAAYIKVATSNEWTLANTFLLINESMLWTFVAIKLLCIYRAKFLAKSFIASSLCLSCLRTNNRLSLGELMHPKCIYFSKPFAQCFDLESCHTWIKTTESDAVFSKVFFLAIFAGNKFGEKYYASFSPKEGDWDFERHERGHEGPEAPGDAPTPLGAPPKALGHLSIVSASPFAWRLIYTKKP